MMKKAFVFLFGVLVFGHTFNVYAQEPADTETTSSAPAVNVSPESWLTEKGKKLLEFLSEEQTKTRYQKLRRLARDIFSEKEMPRLAMGKLWKELTPDQQDKLRRVFFDYFVVTYGSSPFDFSDIKFRVTEKVLSGKDILLKTKVDFSSESDALDSLRKMSPQNEYEDEIRREDKSSEDDGAIEILFAIRKKASGYYIRDAKFEGQSIIMYLRFYLEKEFKKVGNDADRFINDMRDKINARYRAAEDLMKKNTVRTD